MSRKRRTPSPDTVRRRRLLARWSRPAAIAGGVLVALGAAAFGAYAVYGAIHGGEASDRLVAWSADLGLAVADIRVEGRHMTEPAAILRAVGAWRGTPLLAVRPNEAKARLEALPWIRSASVERLFPDTLFIRLEERRPLAFWQEKGKLHLIDREGVVITDERLERFPGLVVFVGADAPRHAAQLIEMIADEPSLARRVVAAVRVGGRRWNLRLDNGIDVQLPEDDPRTAWTQLAALDRKSSLLARDVEAIDLRLPDRLVVRTVPEPPKEPAKKGRAPAKNT